VSTNAEVDTGSITVVMTAIIAQSPRRPEGAVHRTLTIAAPVSDRHASLWAIG